ncbi:MAG: glycosyltransferase family 39 protein [Acidobacteria bacterium]|nr:glycosyltransferase family 39 protein [Acidobacteriota bacterium]
MRQALAVVAVVLLLRLPFLHQAIQGDDVNYLAAAQHAQIDPLHPTHFRFVFQGEEVSMQGHPHPPFNAWFLGGLLAVVGDVEEVRFHVAYVLFSLIAGLAALSLARRFCTRPLLATLLFLSFPAFVVNGNSLESDLPLLAWWLAASALFIAAVDRTSLPLLGAAVACMLPLAMSGFQSVVLIPILGLYLWRERRGWVAGWVALCMIPAAHVGWQLFERLTSEQLPAQVLTRYFSRYGLQTLANKGKNALALTAHFGWMGLAAVPFTRNIGVAVGAAAFGLYIDPHPMFWAPFTAGVLLVVWCVRHGKDYLAQWVLVFFAAALVLFFAGSARYLLPLALPVAVLLTREAGRGMVRAAVALNLTIGLGLASVNYQHWDSYRQLIAKISQDWGYARVWVNSEFGLRHYAEAAGALPLTRGQGVRPGDIVITSKLGFPVPFTTGGGALAPVSETTVTSLLPLRLIGLHSKSAYSTATNGYRAFGLETTPIDVVTIQSVVERKPVLSYVPMNAAESDSQIVSGLDKVEDGKARWMGRKAAVLLKRPGPPAPVVVELYLPDAAPARVVILRVDGIEVARQELPGPGKHTVTSPVLPAADGDATLAIELDKTFSVAGDQRTLGAILIGVGFRQ